MVTLKTLYCSVILQSLTSLKMMITEDQQPKIWGLSVYAYVYACVCYCQRAIFKSPQLASEYSCNLALEHPELNAVLYMEILLCTVSCFLKRLQVSSG